MPNLDPHEDLRMESYHYERAERFRRELHAVVELLDAECISASTPSTGVRLLIARLRSNVNLVKVRERQASLRQAEFDRLLSRIDALQKEADARRRQNATDSRAITRLRNELMQEKREQEREKRMHSHTKRVLRMVCIAAVTWRDKQQTTRHGHPWAFIRWLAREPITNWDKCPENPVNALAENELARHHLQTLRDAIDPVSLPDTWSTSIDADAAAIKLADGLNQLCMLLETAIGGKASPRRMQRLRDIRRSIADIIPE